MIRILDRYILGTFVAALGVFTTAMLSLFVVVDFASKLGKFFALKNVSIPEFVGRYYLLRLPLILTYLLPAVVLFAAVFTIIKLARTNEILPIAASGISVRRISQSFFLGALLAVLLMAAMDEFVLARLGDAISESEEILAQEEVSYGVIAYDGRTLLHAGAYDHVRRSMDKVRVTRLDENARRDEVVIAESCRWEAARGAWVAFGGTVERPQDELVSGNGRPQTRKDPIPAEGYALKTSFGPANVMPTSSWINRFPFARLDDLLTKAREYPHVRPFRMKVHVRFAFPLAPLLLLLLGLPTVTSLTSKSFLRGLFLCFILSFSYYLAHFGCVDLGNQGLLPVAVASWAPTVLFGACGLVSFARLKT